MQLLGLYGDGRAIPALTDVANKDAERWVRDAAAASISKIESRKGKRF